MDQKMRMQDVVKKIGLRRATICAMISRGELPRPRENVQPGDVSRNWKTGTRIALQRRRRRHSTCLGVDDQFMVTDVTTIHLPAWSCNMPSHCSGMHRIVS